MVGSASRTLREHDVAGDVVEVEVAAGGQVGEALLDVGFEFSSGAAEHAPVAEVEAELLALVADEVEHGQHVLAFGAAQAAAELLEEDRGALGGAQHEHDVDGGDVDALVEQVDGEQHLHLAVSQIGERLASVGVGRLRRDGPCRDPGPLEPVGHEVGVVDADAEAERPHLAWLADLVSDRGDDLGRPHVVGGVEVGQLARCRSPGLAAR